MNEPLEPLDSRVKDALEAARWPEPAAGLEEQLLGSLRTAWPAAAGASGAAAPLLGKLGVVTTTVALLAGTAAGALLHARFAEPKIVTETRVEKVIVEVPAPALPVAPAEPSPPPAPPKPVRPVAVKPAADSDAALAEEHRLIQMARAALLRREPVLALAPLGDHAKRFPSGQLAEERASLEIQALVATGRGDEARAKAAAFHRTWPQSLLGSGIDQVLSTLPSEKK